MILVCDTGTFVVLAYQRVKCGEQSQTEKKGKQIEEKREKVIKEIKEKKKQLERRANLNCLRNGITNVAIV